MKEGEFNAPSADMSRGSIWVGTYVPDSGEVDYHKEIVAGQIPDTDFTDILEEKIEIDPHEKIEYTDRGTYTGERIAVLAELPGREGGYSYMELTELCSSIDSVTRPAGKILAAVVPGPPLRNAFIEGYSKREVSILSNEEHKMKAEFIMFNDKKASDLRDILKGADRIRSDSADDTRYNPEMDGTRVITDAIPGGERISHSKDPIKMMEDIRTLLNPLDANIEEGGEWEELLKDSGVVLDDIVEVKFKSEKISG